MKKESGRVKREMLVEKLHPVQFCGATGLWHAIVGCIIGEAVTEPAIAQLVVTSDDCVLASHFGRGPLCNAFIGALSDLRENWRRYCAAAELSDAEQAEADRWFREAVGRPARSDDRPTPRRPSDEPLPSLREG